MKNFDNDDFLKSYAQKKFNDLKSNFKEYTDEEELINKTIEGKGTLVVHFFSEEFEKCKILNKKLEEVVREYEKIEFVKINANNCPKMCKSLEIQTLPFLCVFKDGYLINSSVGFEKLGNKENIDQNSLKLFLNQIVK
ncbi:PLP1 [Hepatospora eriocheir]|uniref:PLP1 n=1 Tax=Hepatospora eriocheir TaxID=1081669 RepID=A0A1X0Q780_9MICR|nr:PLP1 [Hepatospora eriocheir]